MKKKITSSKWDSYYALIKIFLFILLFVGLFLIGYGITGNTITASDYCKKDIECAVNKVCCEPYGMCYTMEECNNLRANLKDFLNYTPMKKDYSQYTNLGIYLIIFAVICFFIIYLSNKKRKK